MASVEGQTHKVHKKNKEKKVSKTLDKTKLAEIVDGDDGSNQALEPKAQERKAQGVVIDGKTYTCATCKAGHRVGVCKHARDRPMKATHPPGRPSAGAPKKVVCDCPKNCSCLKKDCKCARTCNCTQEMYMLVFIPAGDEGEDEDEDARDEKGTWKIGREVTTDLKGNILTPEQVRERQEIKDALRSNGSGDVRSRSTSVVTTRQDHVRNDMTDAPTVGTKNCCKHKENVASRNLAAQALPRPDMLPEASADGCNCGHACNCAFCPQHPNNSTSINVAREQAIHFANHSSMNDQSIVAFLPTVPQSISCMGGQPRFAMSRHADRPSFEQLQNMFPNPGYVIGYPVWPIRNPQSDFQQSSFSADEQHPFPEPTHGATNTPLSDLQPKYGLMHQDEANEDSIMRYPQAEFGIGDAFVASAGTRYSETGMAPLSQWSYDITPELGSFDKFGNNIDYMPMQAEHPAIFSHNFGNIQSSALFHSTEQDEDVHLENDASSPRVNGRPRRSQENCCQPTSAFQPPLNVDAFVLDHFSPQIEAGQILFDSHSLKSS